MDSVRAITFDAGGTLLEPWPSVGHVYADVAQAHGAGPLDPEAINRQFGIVWKTRESLGFDYSKASWARLVARTLGDLTPAAADPGLFEALWERFVEPSAWRIYEDVVPCLEVLREHGVRLAVLSNWDERLHPLLCNAGLGGYFEFILPSIEGPAPKPDRRLFVQAAERLGLAPGAILHVGDSDAEDYTGAKAAGFHALHLVRRSAVTHPGQVQSLAEVPRRLPKR